MTITSTRKITVAQIRDALVDIADEFPTRTDRRADDDLPARYLDQGEPDCLAALVLIRLGFQVALLRQLDIERPIGDPIHAGVRIAQSRHPALRKMTPAALQLLEYVQRRQARGEPWGHLVASAFKPSRWFRRRDRRARPWVYTEI